MARSIHLISLGVGSSYAAGKMNLRLILPAFQRNSYIVQLIKALGLRVLLRDL